MMLLSVRNEKGMAMGTCMQYGLGSGICDHFDPDNPENNGCLPSGCGENGECTVEADEYPGDGCDSFYGGWDNCDRCGESLDEDGNCPKCDLEVEFEECPECGEDATQCNCDGSDE